LLLFLSRSEAWGWFSLASTAALLVAFAALGAFVTWEERAEQPMIDLQLFRLRSLTTANLASFAGAGTLFGVLLAFPFYLAGSLAFGPLAIAFATVPVAIAYTIVSPLAGRWVNRVGFNRLAMSGYAVAGMGAIWLGATAEQRDILLLTPGVVLLGTGLALATTPITTLAISEVPPERIGVASAFPNISRYVGGALGAALLGAILTASVGGVLDEGSATSAAGRAGVAEGFSRASYASLIFLVLAFFTATRMPRTAGR
jgi:predicted MFS family arabinose efflux permease